MESRKIAIKSFVLYDRKENVLYSATPPTLLYHDVVPETVGEVKYNVLLEIYSEFKKQKFLK